MRRKLHVLIQFEVCDRHSQEFRNHPKPKSRPAHTDTSFPPGTESNRRRFSAVCITNTGWRRRLRNADRVFADHTARHAKCMENGDGQSPPALALRGDPRHVQPQQFFRTRLPNLRKRLVDERNSRNRWEMRRSGSPDQLITPFALTRSAAQLMPKAGFLTHRSSRTGDLPIPEGTVVFFCRPLAAHSGGTARESHPLPFSLAFNDEHLEPVHEYHVACLAVNVAAKPSSGEFRSPKACVRERGESR